MFNYFDLFMLQVRKGVLPQLLEEILSTRIMVKQAIKKLKPSQRVLERVLSFFPWLYNFFVCPLHISIISN